MKAQEAHPVTVSLNAALEARARTSLTLFKERDDNAPRAPVAGLRAGSVLPRLGVLVAVSFCMSVALVQCAGPSGTVALELTEESAVKLPADFEPVGAFIADSPSILLWSPSGRLIQIGTVSLELQRDVQAPTPGLLAARIVDHGSWIEYVDANERTTIRVDSAGGVRSRVPLVVPPAKSGKWVGAIDHENGWLVVIGLTDSSFTIVDASPSTLGRRLQRRDLGLRFRAPVRLWELAGHTAVISESDPIADTMVLDAPGFGLRPSTSATLQQWLAARPLAAWRALPPVDVGRGYIQTISDLRSDHRITVRYDSAGRPVRVTHTNAPIGYVGSVPRTATLFAIRGGPRREIVRYRWRWFQDTSSP